MHVVFYHVCLVMCVFTLDMVCNYILYASDVHVTLEMDASVWLWSDLTLHAFLLQPNMTVTYFRFHGIKPTKETEVYKFKVCFNIN